jgi:hypothetical protein
VVVFWDLDNWMLIGMLLIVSGFLGLIPAMRGERAV